LIILWNKLNNTSFVHFLIFSFAGKKVILLNLFLKFNTTLILLFYFYSS